MDDVDTAGDAPPPATRERELPRDNLGLGSDYTTVRLERLARIPPRTPSVAL